MRVAYAVFVREKAHNAVWLERAVRSALAQTYGTEAAPMEILLSDQGSQDGTREILARLAGEYEGPNTVRLLDCPETAVRGMAGLNAHLAWLMDQTDAEIFIHHAGDDTAHPERAAVLAEAFERTGADMVGAAMEFADPAGVKPTARSGYARTGWVSVEDMVVSKVGGSAAAGWRRDLWARIAPTPAICSPDVWMPPLACVLGGFYYLNRPLYTYYHHADPTNTGLEGALLAAPDDAARRVIDEHRFFQTAASWQWVLRRMESLGVGSPADRAVVRESVYAHADAWLNTRMEQAVNREAPKAFPI